MQKVVTTSWRYRKHILERDWHKCIISWKTDDLQIHHIKTRWSWWKDDYKNLVTLNKYIHTGKVHWQEWWKYRPILEDYVKDFKEPDFWQEEMELHKDDAKKVHKKSKVKNEKYNKLNKERMQKYKTKRDEKYIKEFWMSYSKYCYQKQKEYYKTNKNFYQ